MPQNAAHGVQQDGSANRAGGPPGVPLQLSEADRQRHRAPDEPLACDLGVVPNDVLEVASPAALTGDGAFGLQRQVLAAAPPALEWSKIRHAVDYTNQGLRSIYSADL